MNKSEFYRIWYTNRGVELSTNGFPRVMFAKNADPDNNDPKFVVSKDPTFVETAEDWEKFLITEPEVAVLCRHDKDACALVGTVYEPPYEQSRSAHYPDITEQLDSVYKSLKAIKDSGIDLGEIGNAYVNEITAIKENYPKN